jgi:hypothetical protein
MPSIDPSTTQKRTALELFNTVLGELGMPSTSSVNATDDTTVQLLYLANGLGTRLGRLPFWSELVEEFTITTTTATSYTLPVDWGVPLPGTTWDRTASWPLRGPVTSIEWQWLVSGITPSAPQYRYRYKGGAFHLHTAPSAGLTIVQEYLSTGWVLGMGTTVADTRKPRITSDSDYILLDEEMFITGAKLAWLEAKGLDSSKALEAFRTQLEAAWGSSAGSPILSYVPGCGDAPLLSYSNVPDTGYGA